MKKLILWGLLISTVLWGHDFGDVPETKFDEIKESRPYMIMVGKTHCIWCDSMAPQIKEIKAEYPQTVFYYINADIDILGTINHDISELPVQLL